MAPRPRHPSQRIAEDHTVFGVATARALREGVDLDVKIDRLLWLEAQGLAIARDARRLRRRAPRVALVDEDALIKEIARLSLVTRSRRDEVRLWRSLGRPVRRGRIVEPPAPRGLWARIRSLLGI